MIYFNTKSDLEFINQFLATFERLYAYEADSRRMLKERKTQWVSPQGMFRDIREEAAKSFPDYSPTRTTYTKMIPRIIEITEREGILHRWQIQAAPLEGMTTFSGSIYSAMLERPSDLADLDSLFRDTINEITGKLEQKIEREFRQLVNPLYWLKQIIVLIIRLPYTLISLSGFDVKKVEEHMLGRLFQLAYVISLILILVRFGLQPDQWIKTVTSWLKP